MGSSVLVVNHRVALRGTPELRGVLSHTVSYVGTREGCVLEPTRDDGLRQESGFIDYVSERPGAVRDNRECGLFDAEGATTVAEARNAIASSDSAVVTSVVSVRREDGVELGLHTKQDFERYLRTNWAPAMAEAMGVPEDRVGWVAAFHLNSRSSYHAHVITWDRAGRFNHVLDRRRMENARGTLASAAVAPALRALARQRSAVRERCVNAAREIGASELEGKVQLPSSGSLKYEWLRREHPAAAAEVDRAISRVLGEGGSLATDAKEQLGCAERAAELKGLTGPERQRYIDATMNELRDRVGNAMLHSLRPDRQARARRTRCQASSQMREGRVLTREIRDELGALPRAERQRIASEIHEARLPHKRDLQRCPSLSAPSGDPRFLSALGLQAASIAGGLAGQEERARDAGSEVDRDLLDGLARAAALAMTALGVGANGGRAIGKVVVRTVEIAT